MVQENVVIAIILIIFFILIAIISYVIYAIQHQVGFFNRQKREVDDEMSEV